MPSAIFGHHDDRKLGELRIASDALDDLDAVDDREDTLDEQHVRLRAQTSGDGLEPVRGGGDDKARFADAADSRSSRRTCDVATMMRRCAAPCGFA